MWFVLVPLAIVYVLRYAAGSRDGPRRSIVGISPTDAEDARGLIDDVPSSTGRQKLVLVLFAGSFVVMIYGFIPWNDLWQEGWGTDFPLPTFASFYFPEAAALFFVMAVVVGLIAKLGEEGTVNTIIAGAADFLGAALIIVLARGDHGRDEEHVHDRHRPALDGGRGLRHLGGRVRRDHADRQHPDRVPGAVLVRARRARDADPRAAGGLRRRRARRSPSPRTSPRPAS